MFGGLCDDVWTVASQGPHKSQNGQIVALGRARCPNDISRRATEQSRHLLTCFFHRRLRLPSVGMRGAGGVTKSIAKKRLHDRLHTRVDRGGGVVVHVDWHSHLRHDALFLGHLWLMSDYFRAALWNNKQMSLTLRRHFTTAR